MQDGQQPNEPGWVFRPGNSIPETTELPAVVAAEPAPQPEAAPIAPAQPFPETQTDIPSPSPSGSHIEWTASEYIANPKNTGWFMLLAGGSFALAVVVFIVSREIIGTMMIAIMGVLVGIFAARQPQTLQYRIDSQGIHIGERFYPYRGFKAFSVAHEHAIGFISLLPLRRFMPPIVIHYSPEDEQTISEVLASYLPYEEHKVDIVDNLTRKFRF